MGAAAIYEMVSSANKAIPHVASKVEIRSYNLPDANWVKRYAIFTTIYNDGDLAARNVDGRWKLTISHLMGSAEKIIRRDTLSASYPWEDKHEISGNTNWFDTQRVDVEVDIELYYFGLDESRQIYKATYKYDHSQKAMIQS